MGAASPPGADGGQMSLRGSSGGEAPSPHGPATVAKGTPARGTVLFVSYHFPPSMEMGAQACAQIARYLPRYGWSPVVLTVKERYAELAGDALEAEFPGRVVRTGLLPHPLAIYRGLKSRFRTDRHGTTRSDDGPVHRGRLRRWLLSLLLAGDDYTGWIVPASLAGLRISRNRQVQHLLTSGPPWTCHLVGLVVARLTGLPWTAHFRDPWTQVQGKPAMSDASRRIDASLERAIVTQAQSVVCVTEQHAEAMRRVYVGLPPEKFTTIPNGFDGGEWTGLEAGAVASAARPYFVITYSGQLFRGRDPSPVFRALRALVEAGDIDATRVRVEIVGWSDLGRERPVAEMAKECGLADCVVVCGPLSRSEALRTLTRSNLLLLLAAGLTAQVPGKTYEYLRAGRPILALTGSGAVADLLRATGGASVVDPQDVAGIAQAIREAYRRWSEGRPLPGAAPDLVARYDRRVLAERFAELFSANRRRHVDVQRHVVGS